MNDTDMVSLHYEEEEPNMYPNLISTDLEVLGEAINRLQINSSFFEYMSERFIQGEEDILTNLRAVKNMEIGDILNLVGPWLSFIFRF